MAEQILTSQSRYASEYFNNHTDFMFPWSEKTSKSVVNPAAYRRREQTLQGVSAGSTTSWFNGKGLGLVGACYLTFDLPAEGGSGTITYTEVPAANMIKSLIVTHAGKRILDISKYSAWLAYQLSRVRKEQADKLLSAMGGTSAVASGKVCIPIPVPWSNITSKNFEFVPPLNCSLLNDSLQFQVTLNDDSLWTSSSGSHGTLTFNEVKFVYYEYIVAPDVLASITDYAIKCDTFNIITDQALSADTVTDLDVTSLTGKIRKIALNCVNDTDSAASTNQVLRQEDLNYLRLFIDGRFENEQDDTNLSELRMDDVLRGGEDNSDSTYNFGGAMNVVNFEAIDSDRHADGANTGMLHSSGARQVKLNVRAAAASKVDIIGVIKSELFIDGSGRMNLVL